MNVPDPGISNCNGKDFQFNFTQRNKEAQSSLNNPFLNRALAYVACTFIGL